MKLAASFSISLALCSTAFCASPSPSTTELLSRVPLRFEPNRGQIRAAEPVAWTARNAEASYAFTADGALIRTQDHIVRLRMQGANPKAAYQPMDALATPTNYVTAAYKGSVPGYGRLRRSAVYPGIDIVYYGKGTQLEYDFEVAPGADASRIRLKFEGADVDVNQAGDLIIGGDKGSLLQRAPVIYQLAADGTRKAITGGYRAAADGTITIALGKYDKSAKLVIDPTIAYTQYFLGLNSSPAVAVTHDAQGFIYVAGNTQATDFYLVTNNTAFGGNNGSQDAWVMKINPTAPDGNVVPFATYYGGSLNEIVQGIAVDNNGVAYIAGVTTSSDLPTSNPYKSTLPGQQSTFVAAFDTVGAKFIYGTFLGGTVIDYCQGIAYFGGSVYVTGYTTSPDFPVTAGAIETTPRGGTEVFVAQLNPGLSSTSQLVASTLIPGSADDLSRAIAVDAAGLVYVAGETGSPDLPVTANALQGYKLGGDGFLIKLNLQTMQVLYGTYLGGSSYDEIRSIVLEPGGHVAVAGYTISQDFPTTQNAFQPLMSKTGYAAAFLSIVDPGATPGSPAVYSTFFNGDYAEIGYSVARDKNGLYYLTGYTLSANLPLGTGNPLNPTSAGGGLDGFIAQIDPTKGGSSGLLYSSYITSLGTQIGSDVDVDSNGTVYVVGWTTAGIFPPGFAPYPDTNLGVVNGFLLAFKP